MAVKSTVSKKKLPRLSIISYDVIGKNMAGPGIRFYEFARTLSKRLEVTLLIPNKPDIEVEGLRIRQYKQGSFKSLSRYLENSDMILIQGHILYYYPFLKNFSGKIIVDLYNPFNLESLEMFKDLDITERLRIDKNNLNILKLQLSIGDYFICASEKQRDYWVGMLNAVGRVNPYSYDSDSTLRNLIDIVPFGISSQPPQESKSLFREIIPNLREDDKIAIWGGGIWNWLDPITPIKALWEITRNRSNVKLLFMGIRHPDPKLPQMKKCLEAIKLSKELDLFEKNVFFNEWTAYDTRQALLLESDVGLSIHQERIETEFSYRTRVLDYIWAGLPVITTTGDSIAKMVKEENIGEVIKYEDTHQLARVMESMLVNRSLQDIYRKNLKKIRPRFYWENVTEPLVKYCTNPHYAKDKAKIYDLIDLQNSRISRIINKNFEGSTNVLVITRNKLKDAEIIANGAVGKVFYVELDREIGQDHESGEKTDIVGNLKSKITQRTKFDGIIINNAFSSMKPRFFYDLANVMAMNIKKGGMFFFSVPENRGLLERLGEGKKISRSDIRIDDFTIEYIMNNAGFEVIDKGIWDKVENTQELTGEEDFGEVYGKNELFELFEIKFEQQDLEKLKLLSRFDMLESEEFAGDRSLKGRFRKYIYALTSIYFENLRKSYNESIKSINNNIQVQINNEINQLNRKNRERMVLIYYNIFKSLYNEIKGLGYDIKSLRDLLEGIISRKKIKTKIELDQQIEVLLRDLENIDRIMGLSISYKYYVARKK